MSYRIVVEEHPFEREETLEDGGVLRSATFSLLPERSKNDDDALVRGIVGYVTRSKGRPELSIQIAHMREYDVDTTQGITVRGPVATTLLQLCARCFAVSGGVALAPEEDDE